MNENGIEVFKLQDSNMKKEAIGFFCDKLISNKFMVLKGSGLCSDYDVKPETPLWIEEELRSEYSDLIDKKNWVTTQDIVFKNRIYAEIFVRGTVGNGTLWQPNQIERKPILTGKIPDDFPRYCVKNGENLISPFFKPDEIFNDIANSSEYRIYMYEDGNPDEIDVTDMYKTI